jgi:nitroreductase
MELSEAMRRRKSIRRFSEEAVADEDIDFILHAAMSGPSAVNRRPCEFYVVKTPELLDKLRHASPFSSYKSPLVIVVAGNAFRFLPLGAKDYWLEDAGAAAENILLAVTARGLGAVWCGVAPEKGKEKNVRRALNLPFHIVPFAMIFIGHPTETAEPRDKYEANKVHTL